LRVGAMGPSARAQRQNYPDLQPGSGTGRGRGVRLLSLQALCEYRSRTSAAKRSSLIIVVGSPFCRSDSSGCDLSPGGAARNSGGMDEISSQPVMKINGMSRALRIAATGKHRASWSFASSRAPSSQGVAPLNRINHDPLLTLAPALCTAVNGTQASRGDLHPATTAPRPSRTLSQPTRVR
jgi:hypothetical protein